MNYRHMIYRYSTGQGPNAAIDVPDFNLDMAAFALQPQVYELGGVNLPIDLKREADRLSMQVEAAQQALKNLGTNPTATANFNKLKARLDMLMYIQDNFPLKAIKRRDLDYFYGLDLSNKPLVNKALKLLLDTMRSRPVKSNKLTTAYDAFGRVKNPTVTNKPFQLDGFTDDPSIKLVLLGVALAIILPKLLR